MIIYTCKPINFKHCYTAKDNSSSDIDRTCQNKRKNEIREKESTRQLLQFEIDLHHTRPVEIYSEFFYSFALKFFYLRICLESQSFRGRTCQNIEF
jgi:hypothetical protein